MALTGDKKKEYQRQLMAKRRGLTNDSMGLTEETEMLDPDTQDVRPSVIPSTVQDAGWPHVIEFLRRPARAGDIDNMLKLQRIAGALAHVSRDAKDTPVWFGSLDVRDIGKVIGTAEPNLPPVGPPVRV